MPVGQSTRPVTLAECGFKLNELVLFLSDKESTGGVVFQIVEDNEPVKVAIKSRPTTVRRSEWDPKTGKHEVRMVPSIEHGEWDEHGKKIEAKDVAGYVRIKPIFEFFATPKGKKPKGKGATLIIYYRDIRQCLQRVDITQLGAKYLELGNLMRDIVRVGGMEDASA